MIITTFAGTGTAGTNGDHGAATSAQLNNPEGVAVDIRGNVYIADDGNHKVRLVNSAGIITTYAGTGGYGYSGDGGKATSAYFNSLTGVAVDLSGNMYIADQPNNNIRLVTSSGIITTFAGTGTAGRSGDGGKASSAQLQFPNGVAVDISGNVYIADYGNYKVRLVNSAGIITTYAGTGGYAYSGDGGAATSAQLNGPNGVAVNSVGTIYIADSNNYVIRMVNSAGIITTFAGTGRVAGSAGDGGVPTSCLLGYPSAVAVDTSNRVYVIDDNKIRVISMTYACPAGNYMSSTSSGTCALCPTGSYQAASSSATSCNLCSASTYMSSTGATSCMACPAGTMSFVLGATSAASCATVR